MLLRARFRLWAIILVLLALVMPLQIEPFARATGAFPAKAEEEGGDISGRPLAVAFVDAHHGWVVAGDCEPFRPVDCGILATVDGGQSWTTQWRETLSLAEVTFLDPATGWVLGYAGPDCARAGGDCGSVVLGTIDGGATWEAVGGAEVQLSGLQFVDSAHGWALGERCSGLGIQSRCHRELWSTADGGVTWGLALIDEFFPTSISFVDAWRGWAAGWGCADPTAAARQTPCPAGVVATTDGGQTWQAQLQSPGDQYGVDSHVSFLDATNGWLVATPPQGCTMGGCWGPLYATGDGGAAWLLLQEPGRWRITGAIGGPPGFPGTPRFVTPMVGWLPIRAGAGPGVGGVAVTSNAGQTWTRYGGDPDWTVSAVSPVSEDEAWIVGASPQAGSLQRWLRHTTDRGRTWTQQLPPY